MLRFFQIEFQVVLNQVFKDFLLLHVFHVLLFADLTKLDVDVFLLDGFFGIDEFHFLRGLKPNFDIENGLCKKIQSLNSKTKISNLYKMYVAPKFL
jgi:hypothetical protein